MKYVFAELRDQVLTAHGCGKSLWIEGGASKAFYGNRGVPPTPHARLDMTAYRGVVSYQPTELVITARAGTPLDELEAQLAEQGQMLAFEPPHFGAPGSRATLGGCIAAGLAGPQRVAAGGVRDFVLGASLLTADGRALHFGGEVMKNVAGYDVSRLLAGSLGIFGAITEVSLKVVPKPLCERTLCLEANEHEALALFGCWRALPLPVSASAWVPDGTPGGVLWVRLSGSEPAVAAACAQIGGQAQDDALAQAFWCSLREQTHDFFTRPEPLWRLTVPPVCAPLELAANLLEWGGGQRWIASRSLTAQQARQTAAEAGGHATLFRRGAHSVEPPDGVFPPLSAGNGAIVRALKHEFDPSGLFNPDRMYPGL